MQCYRLALCIIQLSRYDGRYICIGTIRYAHKGRVCAVPIDEQPVMIPRAAAMDDTPAALVADMEQLVRLPMQTHQTARAGAASMNGGEHNALRTS